MERVNQRVHITSNNGIPGPVRTSIGVFGRQVKHWEFLRGVPNVVKNYYSRCFQDWPLVRARSTAVIEPFNNDVIRGKHCGSSLSPWLIISNLISTLFTPFVPICSQFSFYICYQGEFTKHRPHSFSTNDIIIKRVYSTLLRLGNVNILSPNKPIKGKLLLSI